MSTSRGSGPIRRRASNATRQPPSPGRSDPDTRQRLRYFDSATYHSASASSACASKIWPSRMVQITPPVAGAALVAAKIADAGYFATAFNACRFGLAGFVLPFMFVYAPAILLLAGKAVVVTLTSAGALFALVAAILGLTGFTWGRSISGNGCWRLSQRA